MFWIVVGIGVVVLGALAWWTSGRAKGRAIDPRRAMLKSDAYAKSQETQTAFKPRLPGR
jgi:hypothetical protein